MLVEVHEREAQLGLPGVALGIALDQWAANAPANPGGGARVDQSAPDHVTGNSEAAPAHMEGHVS